MNYFIWQCYDCMSDLIGFPYFTPNIYFFSSKKPEFFPALLTFNTFEEKAEY